MKSRSKFPKRRSGLPISSIAMAAPPVLPLLFLALWASLCLMGSRAHAQESNADSLHPHHIVERSNANGIETNGAAERINVNEHGTNGPRFEASAQQSEPSPCDVTFGDPPASGDWYRCPSSCTYWTGSAYPQQNEVVGTFTYTASSPVCLSALHAGKIRHGEETYVTVSRHPVNTSFVATVRNRVASTAPAVGPGDNVIGYAIASSSPKAAEETDLSLAELIMIHNNNHQGSSSPLTLACLPNDRGGSLNDNRFFRWNYEAFELKHKDVTLLEQTASSVQITDQPIHNSRVLRCLGLAPALDVTGLFGRINDNSVTRPTVTASIGGTANIRFANNDQSLERLPKNEWASHPSLISDVQLQHAGFYKVSSSYSRLIVRACPAHRYGTNCDSWCPDCLNGGECDATTVRCVCAPGTRGHQCEDYCPEDQYGAECHLNCSKSTLRWSGEGPTSCSGLTFCIRDPKGCSCLPGYKPPMCDDRCDRGHYGPDCALQCNYCNGVDCDRVTGRCNSGCKDPGLCSAAHLPLNLPRLRTPPSVTGCSNKRCYVSLETWDNNSHDGELLEGNVVTSYELELRDEQNQTDWITAGTVYAVQYANEIVYDFIPGRRYSFRVRVLTSVGTADPEYNLRLRETVERTLCLESYVGFVFTVKEITQVSFLIAGMNDESCLPGLQYHLVVWEWSTRMIMRNTTSSATALRVTGLSQNTTYAVIFDGGTVRTVTTLLQPPYPPESIDFYSINSNTAWAKWLRPDRAERYITTLQIVRNEGCNVPNRGPTLFFNTTDEKLYLSDLIPYRRYEFCLMAANKGGQSAPRCVEFVTSARDAPAITLSRLTCTPHQKRMTCSVTVPDDCERLNGPEPSIVWELRGGPACNRSLANHEVFNETYRPGKMGKIFNYLDSMVNYTVEVYVRNQIGRREPGLEEVVLTLPANVPGPVQRLEARSTSTSVVLQWSPPCPPLAPVTSYEVSVSTRSNGAYKNVLLPHCSGQQDHFCYTESGLAPNTEYQIKVQSCAPGRKCSTVERRKIDTIESAPGAPIIKMTGRKTNAISVNFTSPPHLGDRASCYLAAIVGKKNVQNFTQDEELAPNAVMPYTIDGLAPSSLLRLTSRCCNTAGCSDQVELNTSTLLVPLKAEAPLRAVDITDTNATMLLPVIRAGDANISLAVLVQNITGISNSEPVNFTAHYTSWKEDQRSPGREKRSATNPDCSDPSPSVYVAGTAEQDQQKFVLGSGDENNCQLTAGNRYRVAVISEVVLLDQVRVSEFPLPGVLTAGDGGGLLAVAISSIVVALLLILVITITVLVKKKQRQQKQPGPEPTTEEDVNKGVINTLRNQIHWPKQTSSTPDKKPLTRTKGPSVTVTGPTPPPVPDGETSYPLLNHTPANKEPPVEALPIPSQSSKPSSGLKVNLTSDSAHFRKPTAAVRPVKFPEADTIYEDLAEVDPIYGNDSAIPAAEIEAYLNQTINSPSIVNDFMVVPKNYPKSMSDGELPQNKHKNRYRNNLPYNDTRVRLNIINEDPCSDYINANHVQGVTTAKHYIAAQGPKDSDDCTIPDFWRMIVENNVDVIIMVANIVEKNVVKVGTYFSSKGPISLEPLGGSVHVVSLNITPYCTISVIQVTLVLHGSTETRQVTHYHYTKWPDHGVPKEIHTLAQMLHHIATNHQTMCALVHCSAGIGRTGTVIFDLLCYDHLMETQKLDLIAVLVHLRQSRARLVENQMQFKLGLQLLDEILFGFSNITPASTLQNSLPQLLTECQNIFSQLNCLPSSLEYKIGARDENIALNRSRDILPADSRMIFFQNHAGQSPYLNAVSVDSHSEADAYIITEHPLSSTLESFWEMVKQKASPILVVLNNSIDEEYPQMFAEEVNGQMKFGSAVITTTNVHHVCSDLIKRDINVEAGRLQHSVVLYEVVGWHRGAAVPTDETVLTRLADVILGGSLRSDKPPVLVCGDGVTASGLMAGVLRVVERLKQCQDVDIYRTAVMLRRCRREFVVDHIQLQVMIRVAVEYLTSFQDYDNFK